MNLSAVNMCRVVIAVIFFSFLSCVLSTPTGNGTKNQTLCRNTTVMRDSRDTVKSCFKSVVLTNIDKPATNSCTTVDDFKHVLTTHYKTFNETCNTSVVLDKTEIFNLIEFSLRNHTFKEFHSDIKCVINAESVINKCVKDSGLFNITKPKKHYQWITKIRLTYDERNCDAADAMKNCTVEALSSCNTATREYLASLFEFSLKKCNKTKSSAAEQRPSGAPLSSVSAIIIGISVVALLLVS